MSDSRLKKMTQMEREFKDSTNGIEADLIKIYQKSMVNQQDLLKLEKDLLMQQMQPKKPLEIQIQIFKFCKLF